MVNALAKKPTGSALKFKCDKKLNFFFTAAFGKNLAKISSKTSFRRHIWSFLINK